jgi:hypothetical protein
MKSLAKAINKDVFDQESTVDESLIKEYFERNKRKKEDEEWIKKHKSIVIKELQKLNKDKADFGDYRVSYSVPDKSHFDEGKILEFALQKGIFELITKPVLDEDALDRMIEQGLIDLEELKSHAWVEEKGTPRLSVKKVKKQ